MYEHNDSGDRDKHLDAELRRLLQRTVESESEDFVRPSENALNAYIEGTATVSQKREVRRAMMLSEIFQQEMNEYIQGIADLESAELANRMAEIDVPDGELPKAVNRDRDDKSQRSRIYDRVRSHKDLATHTNDVFRAIGDWIWRPSVAYATAAVVLVFAAGTLLIVEPGGDLQRLASDQRVEQVLLKQTLNYRGGSAESTAIAIGHGTDTVDLVIQTPILVNAPVRIRATLTRVPDGLLLALNEDNRRFELVDDDHGHPVFRIDAHLLTPGLYEVEFLPIGNDDSPLEHAKIKGRFEVILD